MLRGDTVKQEERVQNVITISRQFGAGGHTVAALLAKRLGETWQIRDKDIIQQLAESAQVRSRMVEALDERTQSWIQEMVRVVLKEQVLEPMGYRRHLAIVLLTIAQQGPQIIVGRGANYILKDALNVRLEASMKFRSEVIMRRDGISQEKAIALAERVDRERASFTRTMFNRDVNDASDYDIVLQTDTLGFAGTTTVIESAWTEMKKLPLVSGED
jgi:cytidylate kinase